MNTPVNFEIAKLLKEKGFDKPSYSFYVIDESEYGEIGEFITNPNDNYPTLDDNSLFDTLASAPTIAEVVMWLYEKHGVWISVGVDSLFYKGKHHLLIYCKNQGYGLELSSIENSLHGPYESPTEAYSAGIQYTLKNLIS